MAECNPQSLLLEASCFTCLPAEQQYLVKLAILCRILNGVTLPCDVNTLLEEAKCFACLPPGIWPILELQLLCEISQGGGGGSVNCDPIAAKIYSDVQQTIPEETVAAVTFNAEEFDTDNMADIGANPSIITIQQDGIFEIIANVYWDAGANAGAVNALLYKNGNLPDGVGSTLIGTQVLPFDGTRPVVTTVVSEAEAVAGDYFWVQVYTSGGAAAVLGSAGSAFTQLMANKIVGCQES